MNRNLTRQRVLVLVLLITTSVLVRFSAPLRAQEANVVMDIGFRPGEHGFGFENYGGQGETNLTPAEMVRLFGEEVCASAPDAKGSCRLTATAAAWMEETSEAMEGGHCEGMAVLSLLLYAGALNPSEFGANQTVDLSLEDKNLQREIAMWWATQATSPTYDSIFTGTPTDVVNELITNMKDELYTIGIYLPDGDGGHAITPYAVQDMGDDIFYIMVYDNNYPGEERFIEVDTREDTWVYTGSTNPNEESQEYFGDAETETLDLTPMGPRLDQQLCDFCGAAADYEEEPDEEAFFSASLNGQGNLIITDSQGRISGFENGQKFAEIPGTRIVPAKSRGAAYRGATIEISGGKTFTIMVSAVEGSNPATRINIERRGTIFSAKNITLGTEPVHLIVDGNTVKIDGNSIGGGTKPASVQQAVTSQNGFNNVYGISGASGNLGFEIDPATGNARASGSGAGKLFVNRTDPSGSTKTYYSDDLVFTDDGFVLLEVEFWEETLVLVVEDESGNVLDTLELEAEPLDESFLDDFGFEDDYDYFDVEDDGLLDDGDTDDDGIDDSEDADFEGDEDGDEGDDEEDGGDEDTGDEDEGDEGGEDDTGDDEG